ncbi:DUF4139 domain-containing protein [Ancylomarina longa]|uniref:Mucoidy inhibitor MuiA family protein n=1 Tax=Ancylomarina longa TaxID=2487017 RepID=A0A434AEN6_9BACT|nr:DUF4139 domain-containing protein [Ancylomarina longa]RUT72839.1 mucoidy inhibitor MuiA family protein [Ancylomarina longa]
MKALNLIVLLLFVSNIFAQEIQVKEIKSEVNEVTVFLEGAQVTRTKKVELMNGITILKFVNLSPFIDAKSVQIKANGDVTVLSVNHQQNYIDKLEKPRDIKVLESKIEEINKQLNLEKTYLSILNEELAFLKENRAIGGKYNELSVTNLKEAAEYYSTKLTSIKLKEIERNKTIEDLQKQKRNFENQLKTLSSKKEFPTGEILVKVRTKSKAYPKIELSYLVENTGWFPTYDIRAKDISEPVEIIYKANLRQDTKVNWNNVKLKFSSSNPNTSGVAPQLKTYYLGYNTKPPVYNRSINSVSGQVFDHEKSPLPGVTVVVSGTSIGTTTDMNGNYSLTLPSNANQLNYSFIGYEKQTLPVSSSVMNVYMNENFLPLEEVVTVGYGSKKKRDLTSALQGKVAGVRIRGTSSVRSRGSESNAIPFQKTENQTSINFEIKTPYTIKSDNKNYSVDMIVYDVPASYQYFCIPKIDKDAFLIANITDWEKYNLLEGEANIFFEETYIGKTLLDVRFASDTLQLSLGRDKNVSVSREKVKDHTTKQFIGTKKEQTRGWKTTVKNNKSQKIQMIVLDQIPVSRFEEIEVELQASSGGKYEKESGEIKWNFTLDPTNKKELELKYSVKYPKSRKLNIE